MQLSQALRVLAATGVATAALTSAAHAAGQDPPEVHAGATGDAVTVTAPAGLRPGAVRIRLSVHSPAKPQTLTVIKLADGADPAKVAAIDSHGLADVRELERSGTLVTGATVRPGVGFRTTVVAGAGRYVVIDESGADRPYATFTIAGAASGAATPRSDARLRITDHGFELPERLPSLGVLRIDNAGTRAHHVLAVRISPRLTDRQAVRRIRAGASPARVGYAQDVLGLVSAGTTNRVRYRLKAGRWVLVSSYGAAIPGGRPDVLRGLVTVVHVHR